jgi:hypothetical protein
MTQAGRVNLKPTFFLQKTKLMPTAAAQATGSPALVNAGTNAVTHAGSPATGYTLPLGWYSVGYNFENKYGYTVGIAATTTPEVECDNTAVSLTMTIGTTPATATHVNMYISEVQTSEALALAEATAGRLYWVQKFPLLVGDGAYVYNCKRLPNTYTAFIGQMTPDVLTFRQLAPLVKMDLATIAPAYKWMILLYGVPVIFAPLKWTRVINIKY